MHKDLLKCPACNFEPLEVTIESDSEIVFFCEECGWSKVETDYFYPTGWYMEINQALAPVDILQSLLTAEDITLFLKPRLKGVSHLSNYEDASPDYLLGEVNIAYAVYLRQMIVLATTYVELLLKDFFKYLFVFNPQRMNPYLAPDGKGKAIISLNEILLTESKEFLLASLAEKAASRAVGPKFDKVVERLIRDCQLNYDKSLVENLRNLNELRNCIVHEGKVVEVDIQQVHDNFDLLLHLLYVLKEAAEKCKIIYWDDFGLVDDFEKVGG
ncbi:MAG: hypothetical protein GY845_36855 [Planctomycetes bacterium]|nr:hypothetical protein [Planctomycetota bacterium]